MSESATPPEASETWLPVVGWEADYDVSDLGRVRSRKRSDGVPRLLKPFPSGKYSYLAVKLCRDGVAVTRHVHRLVADAFLGPLPEGCQTRHGPGGALDNRLVNLCYGTPQDNGEDMIRDGTSRPGSDNHFAKLTWEAVADIRLRIAAGETQQSVAQRYGVTQPNVSAIISGSTWKPHNRSA